MNSGALDILAATNPALGSLVLYFFVQSYTQAAGEAPEFGLAHLPVPVALSATILRTFEGTTAATGLLGWTAREPSVLLHLPELVAEATPVSRAALLFGLQRGILVVVGPRVTIRPDGLRKLPRDPTGVDITQRPFAVAARFGKWCGTMKSPTMVFVTLGMRV